MNQLTSSQLIISLYVKQVIYNLFIRKDFFKLISIRYKCVRPGFTVFQKLVHINKVRLRPDSENLENLVRNSNSNEIGAYIYLRIQTNFTISLED